MTTEMNRGGGSAIGVLFIALFIGLFVFLGFMAMTSGSSPQTNTAVDTSLELHNITVDDGYNDLDDDAIIPDYLMTVEHAVNRHGPIAKAIIDFCRPDFNQLRMYNSFLDRDAFICLMNGKWVVHIEGEAINGDKTVTAFPRKAAQTLQDVIDYMVGKGYVQ